jgi:hypothetical protein
MGQFGFFDADRRLAAITIIRYPRRRRTRTAKRAEFERAEHVFGAQQNSPGGRIVRTIGIARAKAKIGLQNLAYNMRRLVTLERMAAAWGSSVPRRAPCGRLPHQTLHTHDKL